MGLKRTPAIRMRETDGSPDLLSVRDLILPNQSLSDDGGGTATLTVATIQEVLALIDSQSAQNATGLVSGGEVVWESGLTFRISKGTAYIAGTKVEFDEQTVTLDAADANDDRIDVIGVDINGDAFEIAGTPAATPSEPSIDPETQLKLIIVDVPEDATEASVTNTEIYKEGSEWTDTTSGSGWTLDSTNNPRNGTKCEEATSVAATAYIQWQSGVAVDLTGKQYLVLYVRSKAAWPSTKMLRLRFQSTGVTVGVEVTLKDGYWGFDSSITSAYQQVAIPITQFQVPANQTVTQLRATVTGSGGSIGFYLDDIFLQAGIEFAAPDIPYATTTTPGIVELATDGEAAANVVVQGNDARLNAAADLAAHLADTADAHDASAISILDAANDFTATDVEGALAELQTDHEADAQALSDHIADSSDAHDASAISVADSGGFFAATDVEAALAEIAASLRALTANNQTGTTYELVLSDAGKIIECNNGSAIALTIPANASVAFPVGTVIQVYQMGAGQVTVGITSDTLRAPNGAKTQAQYSVLSLWKQASTVWVLSGDSEA